MLTIRHTRVFPGPSLWAPVPAIVLQVAIGELEDVLSTQTPVFFERLTTLIPSLRDHGDVVNRVEGGLQRLLLDQIALALQQLAGAEVSIAQTHPTAKRGVYTVTYQYQHEDVGRAAGELAVRLLNHLLDQREPDFAFDQEVEAAILHLAKRHTSSSVTNAIMDAAEQRGIPALVAVGRERVEGAKDVRDEQRGLFEVSRVGVGKRVVTGFHVHEHRFDHRPEVAPGARPVVVEDTGDAGDVGRARIARHELLDEVLGPRSHVGR